MTSISTLTQESGRNCAKLTTGSQPGSRTEVLPTTATCVSFRVPLLGVRISPALHRVRVQVVEDALHHPRIEEQPLNLVSLPFATSVGGFAIDEELFALNGHLGFTWSISQVLCRD